MSYTKDFLMDFERTYHYENYEDCDNFEEFQNSRMSEIYENYEDYIKIKAQHDFILELCSIQKTEPSADEREFLSDLFPNLGEHSLLWAMAKKEQAVFNVSFSNFEEALANLTAWRQYPTDLYFCPATFNGWRNDKNAISISTIYTDIDDMNINFSKMNETDMIRFLTETFHLPLELLPNWAVASGHGLHLYYLINTLNLNDAADSAKRLTYTDYIITYFKGDIACRNKSRILRFPNSYNIKNPDDIRRTQLYHLNSSSDRSLSRLDFFQCSQSEIDEYIKNCNAARTEKRRQTMITNGTWKNSVDKKAKNKDSLSIQRETKQRTLKQETQKQTTSQPSHPELQVNMTTLPSSTRYRRILRDLHNWAARRQGVPMGYRAIFTHIVAVFLKRTKTTEEIAKDYVSQYVDVGFLEEAAGIVKSVYESKTEYQYTNERIASLLDFTEEDLKNSFSAYTEKQKKEASKKRNTTYHNKIYKEERRKREEFKNQRYEYVKNHPHKTAAELAEYFGCATRTIKRIRAQIKQN